jgi:hypothetical protein
VQKHSSKELTGSILSELLKVNLKKEKKILFKTSDQNLINHPFIFFLQILCFLELNASEFSNIHCVYLDCTGSFQRGLIKKRFPSALKAILHIPCLEKLPADHLPAKPSKFSLLFSDSLIYKSDFDLSSFEAAIFWASKEEELNSTEVLKTYASLQLFHHALGNT